MSLSDVLGSSEFGGLLGTLAQVYNIENTAQKLGDVGTTAAEAGARIGGEAQAASQFQPFSIMSGTGGVNTTPTGGTNLSLSPQQQALQQSLFGLQGNLAGQLGQQNPMYQQLQQLGLGGAMSQFGNIAGAGSQFGGAQQQLMGLGQLSGMQAARPSGFEGMSQQALQLGQQGLGQFSNPLAALQSQYGGLAQQATQGLLQDRTAREQDIYGSIRAMQQPEEMRAQQNLDQQLFAQGRGGVRTAQFGGTPEQLARSKAVAEARNSASFGAMQQAGQEQQQDLQRALGLSGQAASLTGQGEQLRAAEQARALGLGGFGMQGMQAGQGLQSQYLQNALAAQQGAGGLAGLQQQLQQGQLGLTSGMFGLGQQAGLGDSQQQQALLQNLLGSQQAGFAPDNQLLNQLQASTNIASLADYGRRTGAMLSSETELSGIDMLLRSQLGAADARGQYGSALSGLLGSGVQGQTNVLGGLLGSIFGGASGSDEGGLGGTINMDSVNSALSSLGIKP